MADKKTGANKPAPGAVPKGEAKANILHSTTSASEPVIKGEAKAVILSYRGGRKTRRTNQMLIEVEGADSKTKASAYIGRRVVWKTPSGRLIYGKITHAHGNKGVLRARFPKGLPGEALGKKAKVV